MISIDIRKGKSVTAAKANEIPTGMIPTRFKRHIVKSEMKLNDLSPEEKVVAVLTKCLAIQGSKDNANYYVSGKEMYCPEVLVTGSGKNVHGPTASYSASGRFKAGKAEGDHLRYAVMEFSVRFRDGLDELGLPDLAIEEVTINELPKGSPLNP